MIVTLDGRRLDEPYSSGMTLQSVIDQVREAHLGDRLVISVAVNGHSFGEDELEQRLAAPVKNNDQVDLESGDRREIAAEALLGIAAPLTDAEPNLEQLADLLNAGKISEGMEHISAVVSLWQTCWQTISQCCDLLQQDLTLFVHDKKTVREHTNDLVGKLHELRSGLEARDHVRIADLIRYEMPPLCRTWRALLTQLADAIAAEAEQEEPNA